MATHAHGRPSRARHAKFSLGDEMQRNARRVAQHLKRYCAGYDSETNQFEQPDRSLWWQVVEEALVDTAGLNSDKAKVRKRARAAVEWFWSEGAAEVLEEDLGLVPEYVRLIMRRWLRESGLQDVAA